MNNGCLKVQVFHKVVHCNADVGSSGEYLGYIVLKAVPAGGSGGRISRLNIIVSKAPGSALVLSFPKFGFDHPGVTV